MNTQLQWCTAWTDIRTSTDHVRLCMCVYVCWSVCLGLFINILPGPERDEAHWVRGAVDGVGIQLMNLYPSGRVLVSALQLVHVPVSLSFFLCLCVGVWTCVYVCVFVAYAKIFTPTYSKIIWLNSLTFDPVTTKTTAAQETAATTSTTATTTSRTKTVITTTWTVLAWTFKCVVSCSIEFQFTATFWPPLGEYTPCFSTVRPVGPVSWHKVG